MEKIFDVIIVGGGPAGSSAAIHLRKAGLEVALFEKEVFPRPHVGESLVPFCYELFEELGVLEELKKTTVRKPGVRFINNDGSHSTTYCFKNILKGPNHISFHVLREKFDKQLLDRAKELGTQVYENHKVSHVDLHDPKKIKITVNKQEFTAKFLVDATGQDSFLAKKMKTKTKHQELDRTAFLAHWNADTNKEGLREGLLQLIYLSDSKKGWIGIQPVDVNRVSIGVVCDNSYIKKAKTNYIKNGVSDWKKQFYLDELNKIPYLNNLLKDSKIINKLMVVGDYSYNIKNKFGKNYAIIGDAAGFLDPIFATGVYLALNTSKNTTSAIIQLFNEGEKKGEEALMSAYKKYEGALSLLEKFIHNFYNPDFINLAEIGRKIDSKEEEKHSKHLIAFSILHFLMGGDFFNEYEKYSDFIDFLKEPKQLKRYLHLVIDQPNHNTDSCQPVLEDVFPMLKK